MSCLSLLLVAVLRLASLEPQWDAVVDGFDDVLVMVVLLNNLEHCRDVEAGSEAGVHFPEVVQRKSRGFDVE